MVRTLFLLEETPSRETGENLIGSVCVLKSGLSESFSCICQSITGPEGQIDEVNYTAQHPTVGSYHPMHSPHLSLMRRARCLRKELPENIENAVLKKAESFCIWNGCGVSSPAPQQSHRPSQGSAHPISHQPHCSKSSQEAPSCPTATSPWEESPPHTAPHLPPTCTGAFPLFSFSPHGRMRFGTSVNTAPGHWGLCYFSWHLCLNTWGSWAQ